MILHPPPPPLPRPPSHFVFLSGVCLGGQWACHSSPTIRVFYCKQFSGTLVHGGAEEGQLRELALARVCLHVSGPDSLSIHPRDQPHPDRHTWREEGWPACLLQVDVPPTHRRGIGKVSDQSLGQLQAAPMLLAFPGTGSGAPTPAGPKSALYSVSPRRARGWRPQRQTQTTFPRCPLDLISKFKQAGISHSGLRGPPPPGLQTRTWSWACQIRVLKEPVSALTKHQGDPQL